MSNISDIFSALGDVVKSEEEVAALPNLATLTTNVSGNPTAANFLVQGNLFISELAAAQPKIAQDILKDIAPVMVSVAQKAQADLAAAQQKLAAALAGQAASSTSAPTPAASVASAGVSKPA